MAPTANQDDDPVRCENCEKNLDAHGSSGEQQRGLCGPCHQDKQRRRTLEVGR